MILEPFELGHSIPPETKVISPISLGFSASVALDGRRESYVQHKSSSGNGSLPSHVSVRNPTQPVVIGRAHTAAGE